MSTSLRLARATRSVASSCSSSSVASSSTPLRLACRSYASGDRATSEPTPPPPQEPSIKERGPIGTAVVLGGILVIGATVYLNNPFKTLNPSTSWTADSPPSEPQHKGVDLKGNDQTHAQHAAAPARK